VEIGKMSTEADWHKRTYDTAIIDGDILAYRCASTSETLVYRAYNTETCELIGDYTKTELDRLWLEYQIFNIGIDRSAMRVEKYLRDDGADIAKRNIRSVIRNLRKKIKAKEYVVYLTGDNNFRKQVATVQEYKGNRKGCKPKYLQDMRQYLLENYGAIVAHDKEADDLISIALNTSLEQHGDIGMAVHIGLDKDLKTVPGVHYNYKTDEYEAITVNEAYSRMFLQILTGDPTDNIKGLPNISEECKLKYNIPKRGGCGNATATAILSGAETPAEMYARVLEAYCSYYGSDHTYTSWRGDTLTRTCKELMDENADLLFMERREGERWQAYCERVGWSNL
jgi:hypothetical protein